MTKQNTSMGLFFSMFVIFLHLDEQAIHLKLCFFICDDYIFCKEIVLIVGIFFLVYV
jgi:hypothetical protein